MDPADGVSAPASFESLDICDESVNVLDDDDADDIVPF